LIKSTREKKPTSHHTCLDKGIEAEVRFDKILLEIAFGLYRGYLKNYYSSKTTFCDIKMAFTFYFTKKHQLKKKKKKRTKIIIKRLKKTK